MTPASRRRLISIAALAIVMLLWSGNAIVGRALRDAVPPFTLAFLRWSGALAIVLPFAARRLAADRAALQRRWPIVLVLGITGVGCFNALLYTGLRHTGATNAMLLQAAIPALVLLADGVFFRLLPNSVQMAGVLLSVLGVATVVAGGRPSALLSLELGLGELLILGAVLAWAIYTSLLKLRPPVHPASFLAATFAIGAVAMAPLAWHEWQQGDVIRWSAAVFGGIIYVAVFPSVVAYALYNAAVADLGAVRAGQTITLMPLIGAVLSAATLGEPLMNFHYVGMALILLGILVGNAPLHPRALR